MKRALGLLLLVAAFFVVAAAPASAEERTETFRSGPYELGPYEVLQNYTQAGVPKPDRDAFITHMKVDVVDGSGNVVPIQRIMLHHIVFATLGRKDATCNNFKLFDSKTTLPAVAERFYAAGEERAELEFPKGHGYPIKATDNWLMPYMLMNHRNRRDKIYIQYTVTTDDDPAIQSAKPIWLDVRNCRADPVFDVPGGGKPGSTHSESRDWKAPESGRLIAAGGHVHGGAKDLELSQPDCGRKVFTSEPLWGQDDHPFYTVRPVLHEPGPINMSAFTSAKGIPVAKGQRLRLKARYDGELPHTRAMGIMVAYLVPDASVSGCQPLPDDIQEWRSNAPGRGVTPRMRVPITGIVDGGQAQIISAPPGARRTVESGTTIRAEDRFFTKPNVRIDRGDHLNWQFAGSDLHNVTLANGPRGFSSENLDDDREYRQRFRESGTYRIFCSLHPVEMTQTVRVTK